MIGKRLLLAALLATPLTVPAWARDATVVVEQPWARATPGAGTTGSVYLTLTAQGAPDRLIGVATPAAAMAMVHESYVDGGVSRMRMLDGVALEPGKPVTFHPGALHIMLEGLTAPLKAGASLTLTLTFAHAAPMTVSVPVLKPGAAGPDAGAMPGMKMP